MGLVLLATLVPFAFHSARDCGKLRDCLRLGLEQNRQSFERGHWCRGLKELIRTQFAWQKPKAAYAAAQLFGS
jgi:hypothetical protein